MWHVQGDAVVVGQLFAGQVLRTMHIGRAIGVVVGQGVQQGLGFLRGGGVVQVRALLFPSPPLDLAMLEERP